MRAAIKKFKTEGGTTELPGISHLVSFSYQLCNHISKTVIRSLFCTKKCLCYVVRSKVCECSCDGFASAVL